MRSETFGGQDDTVGRFDVRGEEEGRGGRSYCYANSFTFHTLIAVFEDYRYHSISYGIETGERDGRMRTERRHRNWPRSRGKRVIDQNLKSTDTSIEYVTSRRQWQR